MLIDGGCLFCDHHQKTTNHLFFGCEFSKWIMKEAMEASGGLVKTEMVSSLEEAAREIGKVSEGSPAWGLQWCMLGNALFQVWKERNHRRMQGKSDSRHQVLRRTIEMTGIGFDETHFKRKSTTVNERRALLQWDALLMFIHDTDDGG